VPKKEYKEMNSPLPQSITLDQPNFSRYRFLAREGQKVCGHVSDAVAGTQYICTRFPHVDGNHVAADFLQRVRHTWQAEEREDWRDFSEQIL